MSELPDDFLGEAFLRLPPNDPACLLRASLACKRWRRILADPVFRRRHRELHPTPSVLGILCDKRDASYASRFVPNRPASGRPAARDLPGRLVLDCRHGHGRALFLAPSPSLGDELSYDLVVWDPLMNQQRCLARPPARPIYVTCNAAMLCAAVEGCDPRKCHGGPFRVALVWIQGHVDPIMCASVYSSEKDNWSKPIIAQHPYAHSYSFFDMMPCRINLVGDTLYFYFDLDHDLEYQLGAQRLSIIQGPLGQGSQISEFFVMPMGDGGLGCMNVEEGESSLHLQLWSREAASDKPWIRGKTIDLEELLPNGALPSPRRGPDTRSWLNSVRLLGFAEGTDVIFVRTMARNHPRAVYMVQLNSGRAKKVLDQCTVVIPYTSFCIPVTDASTTTEGPGDDVSRS